MKPNLERWKDKYYPVSARLTPKEEAAAHGLRKWTGLWPKTLKRYGITKRDNRLCEGLGTFNVDEMTCALCHHYAFYGNQCTRCPLHKFLGARCDKGPESPYMVWLKAGNPGPMIKALKAVLVLKAQKKEKRVKFRTRVLGQENG